MSKLPNFVIAGSPRAGTTYLAKNLVSHPEVFMAHHGEDYSTGDVHFFDASHEGKDNYNKGIEWYKNTYFENVRNEKLIGEKTADYIWDPFAPELIRKHLDKDVKIMLNLRDPVARAKSHYLHEYGREMTLKDAQDLTVNKKLDVQGVLEAGFYAKHIKVWQKYFDDRHLHISFAEEIKTRPDELFQEISEFLNISYQFNSNDLQKVVNKSPKKGLERFVIKVANFLRRHLPGLLSLMTSSKLSTPVKNYILRSRGLKTEENNNTMKNDEERPRSKLDHFLINLYNESVTELSEILDKDLSLIWPEFKQ